MPYAVRMYEAGILIPDENRYENRYGVLTKEQMEYYLDILGGK